MAETYSQGNVPWYTNTERVLEAKILNKLNAGGGGGGTGSPGAVGIGSPEGVVTANAGTTYLDTSTNSFWVKSSGIGNTGWTELLA
jgi:hypothetical protein